MSKLIKELSEIHMNQINIDKANFNDEIININKAIKMYAYTGGTSLNINIVEYCNKRPSVESISTYMYTVSNKYSIDIIIDLLLNYYISEGLKATTTIINNVIVNIFSLSYLSLKI